MSETKRERPEEIFRKYGGQLRMSEAIAHGITRYMLYALKDRGVIEPVSRGIYRLRELPPLDNPDLVTVSLRFPNAVICLISALAWYGCGAGSRETPQDAKRVQPRRTAPIRQNLSHKPSLGGCTPPGWGVAPHVATRPRIGPTKGCYNRFAIGRFAIGKQRRQPRITGQPLSRVGHHVVNRVGRTATQHQRHQQFAGGSKLLASQ